MQCFSGNDTASRQAGVGISINLDGVILVNSSTISGNSAGWGSGLIVQPNAIAQVQTTIIAGNLLSADSDVYGTLISTGGNVEGPCCSCGFNDPTDKVNVSLVDLALGPLLHYGGPAPTHALLPGRVAIDAGMASGPVTACPAEDQRGELRTDGLSRAHAREGISIKRRGTFAVGDPSARCARVRDDRWGARSRSG